MKKPYWKWFGKKGEFIPGCPARDMTDEEVDLREVRDIVEISLLFEKIEAPEGDKKENK